MSMRRLMAAGGLVCALGAGHISTLRAQETTGSQSADQRFVSHLAASNLLEVRLGQAAQSKATSPAVKNFAQRMVQEHTAMQKRWMEVASKNGLKFRADLSPEQVSQAERLTKASNADFDRAYMSQMILNHRTNVSDFQNERSVGHAVAVRQMIDQNLPALQEHLRLSQQIGSQVGADGTGTIATGGDTSRTFPSLPPRTDTSRTFPTRTDTTVTTNRNPTSYPTTANETQDDRAVKGNVRVDAEFIRDVDADHYLEVRLGRLAQEKGRDPAVRRFGQTMEAQHSSFQKEWSDMGSRNGMKFKSGMGKNHRAKLERLEDMSDTAFDRAYMTMMIQNHQDYLSYWRKEGRAAGSAPVRRYVNRGIPLLEQHMEMAKRTGNAVGVNPDAILAGRRSSANR